MKKFAGLVVILAALVLGGYYAMGVVTERTLRHNLAAVNQTNGVSVNITEYHRGWFKSDAKLDWKLHLPERQVTGSDGQTQTMPAKDINATMPIVIYHGPVIFVDGIHFGLGYGKSEVPLPQEYADKFKQQFTDASTMPKAQLSLFVNYLNNSVIGLDIPAFKLIDRNDNGQFEWQGMQNDFSVTSSADKMDGNMTLDGIQASQDDINANVGKVNLDYQLHKVEGGLYLGDVSFEMPSVIVKKKTDDMFEIDNFTFSTSSDIENSLFSTHVQASLDKIIAQGKTFGPATLEIAVRNLDAPSLIRVHEQAQKMKQGTDLEKEQAMMALLPEIPKLFSKGAEFEVRDFNFVLPDGVVEGNALVTLPEGNFSNPAEVMQKVKGNAELKVPANILKQILDSANASKLKASQAQPASDTSNAAATTTSTDSTTATPTTATPATTTTTTTTVTTTTPDTSDAMKQQVDTQTNQQLTKMVQSGVLVQDGADYKISVTLDQGKFVVNGKPFTPTMLQF